MWDGEFVEGGIVDFIYSVFSIFPRDSDVEAEIEIIPGGALSDNSG